MSTPQSLALQANHKTIVTLHGGQKSMIFIRKHAFKIRIIQVETLLIANANIKDIINTTIKDHELIPTISFTK